MDPLRQARPDFSERLHELRTAELERLPAGARVVLHGGAADTWYFEWFDEHYPTQVERHIAVEYFRDRADDLPEHVTWLRRTLGDLGPVHDGSVDLVFAGQVIEHLWPDDVAGFLLEARRVLRDGGHLVLDSPNRLVTEATGWLHAQHTAELSVDEIAELVRYAGFEIEDVRGVLHSYDRALHRYVGTEEDERLPWERRGAACADRPEECFVWWLVARRGAGEPDEPRLLELAHRCFESFRARRLRRLETPLPVLRDAHGAPRVSAAPGDAGPLFHGPYITIDAGSWLVSFALRLEQAAVDPDLPVGWIDIVTDAGETVHARRELRAGELRPNGEWTALELAVELPQMLMGAELRAFTFGRVRLGAQLGVDLRRQEEMPRPVPPPPPLVSTPEPRTVELLGMLRRRTVARARRALSIRRT
jgi:SAM-dependent methyltransferase